MEIVSRKVSELILYEKNAKKHPPEQVAQIANSLKEFGWKKPIVIDKNSVIVVGHGRIMAAKVLGLQTAPCVIADDLTPKQVQAYRLADNKLNEAPWDFDTLREELQSIDGYDLAGFGFGAVDIKQFDETSEKAEKAKADESDGLIECPRCKHRGTREEFHNDDLEFEY